ncbi:MAG: LysM peptidoglycan-binding domain-containing M23 family metallopeptidase [Microcystaceae cyanobacterium]
MAQNNPNPFSEVCLEPVLSRLQRHVSIEGETVESIAQQYALVPTTILSLNPQLQQEPITSGMVILIPPFNGIAIQVPEGATWKDVATAYGVRADVLFELNGCEVPSDIAFIPGVNWTTEGRQRQIRDYTGLSGYPLPFIAPIGLSYGWHLDSDTQKNVFHSGVDLLADVGTPVLAPEAGQVIFKGNEGAYGFLVIIDHGEGRQTRYAHLSRITVEIGQTVATGDQLGSVGISGQPDISDPHLHFEVRYRLPVGWVAQDPMIHLSVKGSSLESN